MTIFSICHQKRSDKFSKIRKKFSGKVTIKHENVDYQIHNDVLYRSVKRGMLLAVVLKTLTKELISFYHVATAHSGKAAIEEKLKNEPLWLEEKTAGLKQAIDGCIFCCLVQPARFKVKSDIVALKPSNACYAKVFVDLVEITVSDKLLHYLTFLDDFSLYLSVERVNSKERHNVVPKLMLLLSEFGCQGRSLMVSDNGGEFVNHCLRDALEYMHIDQSFISPYNSRANRVERAHRDLRSFIRTANLKYKDADFIVKMSANLYNHRPKEGINGLTPSQVARNIDPPIHFGALKLFNETGNFKTVTEYVEILEEYHTELSRCKREKYLVREKRINELKINDICVIRNPTDKLHAHRKDNLGPYRVLEKRGDSAYLLEHVLLGARVLRNRRLIVKINLGEDEKQILESKRNLMFNSNHEILEENMDTAKIAKSPLDLEAFKKKLKAHDAEEEHEEDDKRRYNLRRRN
jgi:hypothetical protein